MIFDQYRSPEGVMINYSVFECNSADEYHLVITPAAGLSAQKQAASIFNAINNFILLNQLANPVILFERFFTSDISNQIDEIAASFCHPSSRISIIQQPPTNGNKLLAWVYLINFHSGTANAEICDKSRIMHHNGYSHIFTAGLISEQKADSFQQSLELFRSYIDFLEKKEMRLKANCIRTWLYVRDIDNNYPGMVKARNSIFEEEGLSHTTHYIASTGIEGQTARGHSLVAMDAYALGGIEATQVRHLKALSHLSPTHDYGVAFERGTTIDYGDRRHIFISGTASINHKGQILHEKDIALQTDRVFENTEALLHEADASLADVTSMIVYLRDISDTAFTHEYLQRKYPHIPAVVVVAPICRPGWLIEIECTACKKTHNPVFRNF